MATVLVVEDDKLSQRILSKILDGARHTYLAAESASKAWELLRKHVLVDLVILDNQLGPQWGWEFLRDLRQDIVFHEIPVVVYTGHTERSSILKYVELGMKTMLVKPYKAEIIFEEISKAVKADWTGRLLENPPDACERLKIKESDYYSLLSAAASALEKTVKELRAMIATKKEDPARLRDFLQQILSQSTSLGMPVLRTISEALAKAVPAKNAPRVVSNCVDSLESIQGMLRNRALAHMGIGEMVNQSSSLPVEKKPKPSKDVATPAESDYLSVFCRATIAGPIWTFGNHLRRFGHSRLITADEFGTFVHDLAEETPISEFLAVVSFIRRAEQVSTDELVKEIERVPHLKSIFLEIVAQLFGTRDSETTDGMLFAAINRVGIHKTTALIAAARLAQAAPKHSPLNLDMLLEHTLSVTVLAYEIGRIFKLADNHLLAAAGAMHDLGKWAFAVGEPAMYALVLAMNQGAGASMATSEREIFGHTHEEAGVALLELIKAEPLLLQTTAHHARPEAVSQREFMPAAAVIYLANHLAWAAAAENENHAPEIHAELQAPDNVAWVALSRAGVQFPMDIPELFEAVTGVARTSVWISSMLMNIHSKASEAAPLGG